MFTRPFHEQLDVIQNRFAILRMEWIVAINKELAHTQGIKLLQRLFAADAMPPCVHLHAECDKVKPIASYIHFAFINLQ